ncbi:MAG: CaiB/BaiF CoA-transferase family protein [Alphaproteobacteria bacterium]|nr:CaiB/BaiF CoA-transferase family protein [Alphaproteobacteria bacterium]MDG1886781.1 CaiB/BaiF CoA-transferase family protein [Alphaproteobacteria bacterium]
MSKPLEGILVVALEQAVAAPYCTSRLADAGARVIKIERAEGDFARGYDHQVMGQSAYFVWLNRGKESLVLDIKKTDDALLLERILAKADVFIQNLAPGAAERAGFGSEDLRSRYPRLITVDISGYGEDGEYSDMKAYDFLVQGESGLISVTGSPEVMGRVGASVCDIAAGMYSKIAVLEALIKRGRTGEGSTIKTSMFGGMVEWLSPWLLHQAYGELSEQRIGLHHPAIAPYGAYKCANEELILIAVQNQREWGRLCDQVLQKPGLASNEKVIDNVARLANRKFLDREIEDILSSLTRDEVRRRLIDAKIAFGAVNTIEDVVNHPALNKIQVDTPQGRIDVMAPPSTVKGEAIDVLSVPEIGQNNETIRLEFKN